MPAQEFKAYLIGPDDHIIRRIDLYARLRTKPANVPDSSWMARPSSCGKGHDGSPSCSPSTDKAILMRDLQTSLAKLRADAVDADLIAKLATDQQKRELYARWLSTSTAWRTKSRRRLLAGRPNSAPSVTTAGSDKI